MILVPLALTAILLFWLYARQEGWWRPAAPRLHCPRCQAAVEDDFRLCPYCLYELKPHCPHCGRGLESGWTVCPFCGQSTMVTAQSVSGK